jgi:hypothetical protein
VTPELLRQELVLPQQPAAIQRYRWTSSTHWTRNHGADSARRASKRGVPAFSNDLRREFQAKGL